jgi:phage shock protein A
MKVPFGRTRSPGALPDLDRAYRQLLAALGLVRRAVAGAATTRKRLELQLGQMAEQEAGDQGDLHRPDGDPLEALRDQYVAAQEKERRFVAASQRLQREIDAFRLAKEATEAAYVAVQDALHATQAEISDRV